MSYSEETNEEPQFDPVEVTAKQLDISDETLAKEIASAYLDLPEDFKHQLESQTSSPVNGRDTTIRDVLAKFVSSSMCFSMDFFKAGSNTAVTIPGQYTDDIGELSSLLDSPVRNIGLVHSAATDDYKVITDTPSVLFIGECPTEKDVGTCRQLLRFDDNGPAATLDVAMKNAGIPASACYYTTASKFGKPGKAGAFPAKILKICKPFLQYEIWKLKPKVIVCLGNAALQTLFDKKKSLSSVRGMVLSYKGIPVVPTVSPASFYYSQGGLEQFRNEINTVGELARSTLVIPSYDGISYPSRDYEYSSKVEDLERWVNEAIAHRDASGDRWLAVDTETGNDSGQPEDNYIITSQWSLKPNHGRVFIVRGERGKVIHSPADTEKIKELHARLFLDPATRLIGHNLRYDVQQYLMSFSINLVPLFPRYFDTMTAFHKLRFDKEKGLGHLTLLYTNMGPYWYAMEEWVDQNAGKKGLALFPGKKKQRFKHGYRDIIYKYLLPYAACDTDATYRIFLKLKAELGKPGNEKLSDLFYKIDMPCNRFLHEIETNGMPVNTDKLYELSDIYWKKIDELAGKLREAVGWKDFNPGSPDHKVAFLFSGSSGPFKNHEKIAAVAAKMSRTLKAEPVFTSGKFPKPWAKVPAKERATTGVATDRRATKTLCGDLRYKDDEVLKLLSQYSEIVTFAKTFLAKPKLDLDIIALDEEPEEEPDIDPETGNSVDSVDGDLEDEAAEQNFLYGKGLIACTRRDQRIITNVDPLSETGRMKHRNPNMANLPKSKEANAEKVFGFEIPSVRDAFVARPGYVIVEADYSAAEVWTMAYLGHDKGLLDLLQSGADIHTTNARKFFKIGEGLTDDEFKEKHKAKRVAAKAVLFSVAYGTGAEGLALRITLETGKPFPVEDAEQAINGFLTTYPGVAAYLQRMKDAAIGKEYVETPFGRRRYFPGISKLSREAQSAAKREGPNMTIQGTVADMLNSAGDTLWRFRYQSELGKELDFKIMLAIHDAILVEVKEEHAAVMAQVFRLCMSDMQQIPIESSIYKAAKLFVDVECGPAWGDLHKLKTFDKKTAFVTWCEQNTSLLPPIAKARVEQKLKEKKAA